MKAHLIWLAPLALAGCKKSNVDLKNASIAEVAAQMRETGVAATSLKPGLWQATLKLDKASAPGMPEVEAQLQQSAGQAQTMTECLTEQYAQKPFDRFTDGLSDECRYDYFKMGGGKIDNKLVCNGPGGSRQITTQGSYDRETYALKISSDSRGGAIPRAIMDVALDAKRIGDCPKAKS